MRKLETVYIVCKTHFDIGFTDLASKIMERYKEKMLPDVVKTCEDTQKLGKDHEFVWTMSSWPLLKSLDEESVEPELLARAKELLEAGQIDWHVLPYTTHTEFCGLEEFIRGLSFSRELSKEYGRWPIAAKMTDVPGHTWIVPSILKKAGVKFLHLGCNPSSTPPQVPSLFWWEGPDGSRVLTFYNKGAYGTTLMPPKDWKYPVWMALLQTGDNLGPQDADYIQSMVDSIHEEDADCRVIMSNMDAFYKALEPHLGDEVPVVKGDLADSWIHGVGTYPREVRELRELRHTLVDTEKAVSIARVLGIVDDANLTQHDEAIKKAFESSLLFGEHTWGLDVKINLGYDRRYDKKGFNKHLSSDICKRMEVSWQEQTDRVDMTREQVEKVRPDVMHRIAQSVDVDGARFVVFNGTGWKRSGWFDISAYRDAVSGKGLEDAVTGEAIAMRSMGDSLKAYIKDVPAVGYKAVRVVEKDVAHKGQAVTCDATHGILENSYYTIKVNQQDGAICSLVEKANGKEWIDPAKGGMGRYRYDVYGDEDITEFLRAYTYRYFDWSINDFGRMGYPVQDHETFVPQGFDMTCETGNGYAKLIMRASCEGLSVEEYGNAKGVTTIITLYDNCPYIDLELKLDDKQQTPLVEAGHVIFPVNLKKAEVRISKLGSVIDPQKDIVKDANHLLYCCENWVDITDDEHGLAVIPFDTPLLSQGDEAIYQYNHEPTAKASSLYFNLFNNSWGTNFPQWMGGNYSFRFRLVPHAGDWRDGDVQRIALESVTPFVVGYAKSNGEVTVPTAYGVLEHLEGADVVCIKSAEDMDGYILRIREIRGERGSIIMNFAEPVRITPCDLLERLTCEAMPESNRYEIATAPFEIHTYFIEI